MLNNKELDYIDEEEDDDESVLPSNFDITLSPSDYNISTIFSLIESGIIQLPTFQRNFVWDIKKSSKLIESIILGLPIPQIYLYESKKNSFYIIDGQQRLMSIYFYIKGRFPIKHKTLSLKNKLGNAEFINSLNNKELFSDFSLKLSGSDTIGLNPYNKVSYVDLDESIKNIFNISRTIRTINIKQNNPKDDSSMFEIYYRLNTGGMKLNNQEIRMSIYYSDFYDLLLELNENLIWRKIIGGNSDEFRYKDVEYILRIIALHFNINEFNGSLKKFLNTFSYNAKSYEEKKLLEIKEYFENTIGIFKDNSIEDFRLLKGKFSISLFEAIFLNANLSNSGKCFDADIIYEIKNNKEFISLTQHSTTSKNNIQRRIDIARGIYEKHSRIN